MRTIDQTKSARIGEPILEKRQAFSVEWVASDGAG
jgi:hypothetical protein